MIRIGCMSTHPEDVSFLQSEAVRQWALQHNRWVFDWHPAPTDATSADVLLLQTSDLNKHAAQLQLDTREWILFSSNKNDAYRAWQLGASFFLLRPFTIPDLQRALERAEQILCSKRGLLLPAVRQSLEFQLTKGRKLAVQPKDILFLEAQGEVTCVYLALAGQEKIIATRNLGHWERQLEGTDFIRTHKKFLVNISHISGLNAGEILIGSHSLPVAKRRRKAVEKCVHSHQTHFGSGSIWLPEQALVPVVNNF